MSEDSYGIDSPLDQGSDTVGSSVRVGGTIRYATGKSDSAIIPYVILGTLAVLFIYQKVKR